MILTISRKKIFGHSLFQGLNKLLDLSYKIFVGWIFTKMFSPIRVLSQEEIDPNKITVINSFYDGKNNNCKIFDILKGRIFTDRYTYIAISQGRSLVPGASWQWKDGSLAEPEQNPVLVRGTPKPLKYYRGTVLSLLSGGGGNGNYYHWLYDVLPRIALCEQLIELNKVDHFLVPELNLSFQRATLNFLGIDSNKLISSEKIQHLGCDRLIATVHPNPTHFDVPIWIILWLRSQFLPLIETVNHKFKSELNSYIYISRGDTPNKRNILNEKAIINALEKKGFSSYKLADLSIPEQVYLFSNAKVIIGTHGAGFANLAFSNIGTKVVEIFSSQYSPSFRGVAPRMYEKIAKNNSLEYISLVSSDVEDNPSSPLSASFHVSPEELLRIV